jgi:O-acetyl-ADP-ribose deacetylase (regulator of RNase III)
LLASCYRNSLAIAAEHGLKSIAFPGISTGVYGYPVELASRIALDTVKTFLASQGEIWEVVFCCFSAGDLAIYEKLLQERGV